MNQALFEQVDHYITDLLAPEDEALQAVIQSIDKEGIRQISVSAAQGKLLQVLAKVCGARRILEIGTLAGYSTIWMARALPEDGRLITLEYEAHHAAVAQQNIDRAGLTNLVTIKVGAALDTLPQLATAGEAPFDMIFIDADKPPYADYFKWALKLSRKGTIIVADNVIREGKVLDELSEDEKTTGVQRFNQLLADSTEVTAIILQTIGMKGYDGMAVAVVN